MPWLARTDSVGQGFVVALSDAFFCARAQTAMARDFLLESQPDEHGKITADEPCRALIPWAEPKAGLRSQAFTQ